MKQICAMDRTGHSERAAWETSDPEALARGAAVFAELQEKGFTAFKNEEGTADHGRRVGSFEPDTSVIMVPRMAGG